MTDDSERLTAALVQVATDPDAERSFSIECLRSAGTPSFWDERISVAGGDTEAFATIRSMVDEGGEPIGCWSVATTGDRVRSLARLLLAASPWSLPSSEVAPGQDATEYNIVTSAGIGTLILTSDSPAIFALMDLNSELRQVANDLRARHAGAELRCEIELSRESERMLSAAVVLANDGDQGGLVPNPFVLDPGPDDYLRIELGRSEPEQPGVTGIGITYLPVPVHPRPGLDGPWRSPFLFLGPHAKLSVPVRYSVPLPAGDPLHCRAVFSNYTAPRQLGGRPVFCGRAFSSEIDLERVP